jgi:hypothetical protein
MVVTNRGFSNDKFLLVICYLVFVIPFDDSRMVRDAVKGVNRLFNKNTALC